MSPCIVLVCFGFIISLSVLKSQEHHRESRILLDDPNYILQHELSSMKSTLQELQSRILQLEHNSTDQQNEIKDLKHKLAVEQSVVQSLSQQQRLEHGAVYTRWGRKTCPDNGTELVYSGFSGGSYFAHTGVAAEYVCLPTDPIWSKYYDTVVDYNAKMYGGEYHSSFFTNGLGNNDVPCAVCRRLSASSTVMIPGRNLCYAGWNTEYYGYLASGGWPNSHKAASQFVCLDHKPEILFHSNQTDLGKLFYMVEGICGSLSCPPYVNGRELTCAVCTK